MIKEEAACQTNVCARSGRATPTTPPNSTSRRAWAPLRALADTEELADAEARLTNCYGRPLPVDNPLYPLARDIARALTEAGFTLHHCAQHQPGYRLGGVCLLPVADGHDPVGSPGVVVSWTPHNLLSLDWDRWDEYDGVQETMNCALADVLEVLGFRVSPFGTGGAWIVTSRREQPGPSGTVR